MLKKMWKVIVLFIVAFVAWYIFFKPTTFISQKCYDSCETLGQTASMETNDVCYCAPKE